MQPIPLTDLAPRFWVPSDFPEGWKCGISFLCPHCRDIRIAVCFVNAFIPGRALTDMESACWRQYVQQREREGRRQWTRTGETFETLTLSPSIDCSSDGHWHGFIEGGMVK